MGGLYRSTLLRGQVASFRDKVGQDYTILIYHIWRYPKILLTFPHSHSGSGVAGETGE